MSEENKWEAVSENAVTGVCRHKVEGGWLYATTMARPGGFAVTFVPDIDLTRYQAHLRDAYKQGYIDGQLDAKGAHNVNLEVSSPFELPLTIRCQYCGHTCRRNMSQPCPQCQAVHKD